MREYAAADDGTTLVHCICEAVADQCGMDPMELPPLYEVIDPDALEAFLHLPADTPAPTDRTVRFPFNGYEVTVDATGAVDLRAPPGSAVD